MSAIFSCANLSSCPNFKSAILRVNATPKRFTYTEVAEKLKDPR